MQPSRLDSGTDLTVLNRSGMVMAADVKAVLVEIAHREDSRALEA